MAANPAAPLRHSQWSKDPIREEVERAALRLLTSARERRRLAELMASEEEREAQRLGHLAQSLAKRRGV